MEWQDLFEIDHAGLQEIGIDSRIHRDKILKAAKKMKENPNLGRLAWQKAPDSSLRLLAFDGLLWIMPRPSPSGCSFRAASPRA